MSTAWTPQTIEEQGSFDIGFTGSRFPLTEPQEQMLHAYLSGFMGSVTGLHHGDCEGGDEAALRIFRSLYPSLWIYIHPPTDTKLVANCADFLVEGRPDPYVKVLRCKPFMDRNEDIVKASAHVVACPRHDEADSPRSGTWATARRRVKFRKTTHVIMPDGSMKLMKDRRSA